MQVEKAPKPLPACATPVGDGMTVFTRSDYAKEAQDGVMEFLLINHPLDCPICDQGGECQLQDLAVGYGNSASRYAEPKRVVLNKNLGPLISTDMTRCIHCTRCVRFGQEVAGVMELGMIGRGEHAEILAFVGKTVDSELSGNVIDLCPVGALTSKPFRYTARGWELSQAQVRESPRQPRLEPHRAGQAQPRDARPAAGERGAERMLALRPRPLCLRGSELRGAPSAADAEGGRALARGRLAGGARSRRERRSRRSASSTTPGKSGGSPAPTRPSKKWPCSQS